MTGKSDATVFPNAFAGHSTRRSACGAESERSTMSEYETDVYRWSERQGALLRRLAAGERVNDADLDWPHIAEEIETVGRSERTAMASHIANVIEHLITLQASPAIESRAGWHGPIGRARVEVERLFDDSPSLRREVSAIIARDLPRSRRLAAI